MRQKSYLGKLNHRDEQFAYVVKNCHHLSQEQALGLISKNRLTAYQHEQIVRKVHYLHGGQKQFAFELTDKGRAWVRKNFPQLGERFYVSGTAVQHNIRLAEQIIEHSIEHGRTWLNERDLRDELLRHIDCADRAEQHFLLSRLERGELSIPDGGYYQDGQLFTIEVYNNNYSSEMLLSKESCAEAMNASLRFIRQ